MPAATSSSASQSLAEKAGSRLKEDHQKGGAKKGKGADHRRQSGVEVPHTITVGQIADKHGQGEAKRPLPVNQPHLPRLPSRQPVKQSHRQGAEIVVEGCVGAAQGPARPGVDEVRRPKGERRSRQQQIPSQHLPSLHHLFSETKVHSCQVTPARRDATTTAAAPACQPDSEAACHSEVGTEGEAGSTDSGGPASARGGSSMAYPAAAAARPIPPRIADW